MMAKGGPARERECGGEEGGGDGGAAVPPPPAEEPLVRGMPVYSPGDQNSTSAKEKFYGDLRGPPHHTKSK